MPRIKDAFQRIYALQGLMLIIVAAFMLETTSVIQYHFTKKGLREEADRRAESELAVSRLEMEKITGSVESATDNLAWILERELDNPERFFDLFKRMMDSNPVILDGFAAFTPEYYPEKGHWFEPLLARRGDSYEEMVLGSEGHDYFQSDWYTQVIQTGKSYWSEPYFDDSGGRTMVVTYSTPVWDQDGQIVGIVGADLSLAWLTELVVGIQLYPDSFSTLTSRSGQMMACPAETLEVAKTLRYDTQMERTGWKMSIVIPEEEILRHAKKIGGIVLLLQLLGLGLLMLIIWRAAIHLLRLKKERDSKAKIEGELKIASAIQMAMLPKTFPTYPERSDLDLFGSLTPAKEIGGDLFDFFIRDNRLFFCIGDVSGKGIPASLVMAVTRSLFRSTSAHESNPGRIVSHINDAISEGNETNMFVTFFLGILDLNDGHLRYCNAGHNAPLLLTEGDSRPIDVQPNVPLGIMEGLKFATQQRVIPQGSTLFLFTDGLTEAEDAQKELFGDQRLEDATREIAPLSAKEQIQSVIESVREHVQQAPQSDDLTMLSIKFLGYSGDARDRHLMLQNDIKQIPQLADFIEDIAEETGISQALAMNLNLALEEAVVNAILYAYPEGMEGLVEIEALIRDNTVHFIVSDTGRPVDPTQLDDEEDLNRILEDRTNNALGIYMVRNIMDTVYYERTDGRNCLHMTKKLS